MRALIIAIDGPSGVGKGTVARALARRFGYRHVDTGAMYRAVAWKALQDQLPLDDEEVLAELAARVDLDLENGCIRVGGVDVTHAIRTPEIDRAAAMVARLSRVRDVLVRRQRELGRDGAIVMEGRDIGTVVFPAADVKIFLDASPEERARRRATDPAHTDAPADVSHVAEAMRIRDELDRTRAASPLAVAPDAVPIDTTGIRADDVIARVVAIVEERLREHE